MIGFSIRHLPYCSLYLASCWFLGLAPLANAQVIPDTTLPNQTRVFLEGNTNRIEGGTQVGGNLFHSFQEFSVSTGSAAFFNNSTAIQNIISRVTGGKISNIDGLIRANGTANLFLLNPSGIILGPNAQLNVGGSFFASTANSLQFADGNSFSVNPQTPPLLTVSVPVGLQFATSSHSKAVGRIVNQSKVTDSKGGEVGLQVNPGQTLGLIGGEIKLDGGHLTALGGEIQLGSVVAGTWSLQTPPSSSLVTGDILLGQQATVNASGLGGGAIRIQGRNVVLDGGASIASDTSGNLDGRGIDIQARQLSIQGGSFISSSTFGPGKGGDLKISAEESVSIVGSTPYAIIAKLLGGEFGPSDRRGGIFVVAGGPGNAGNVTLTAPRLTIANGGALLTPTLGPGQGGDLAIVASQAVEILAGSAIVGGTTDIGNSGSVTVNTPLLRGLSGGLITTSPSASASGRGGNLTVTADRVEFIGVPPGAPVPGGLFTTTLGEGNAGDLNVKAGELVLREGTQISSSSAGAGRGGNLTVDASTIEISGISQDKRFLSGLLTSSSLLTVAGQRGKAAAGNLTVTADRIQVRDGGQISAATGGEGQAGNLTITARKSIEVSGIATSVDPSVESVSFGTVGDGIVPSAIESNTSGSGQAGDLIIQTGLLNIRNGAEVGVRGTGSGRAGNLQVTAQVIRLDNEGSISAATASGGGGNMLIKADSLQLRQGSNITTNAGSADGGDITLNVGSLAALENSDITANAEKGSGGRVIINTQGLFGSAFRPEQTSQSDITATSDLGPQFSGVVQINTPNINPSSGLIELPTEVVDVASLTVQGCTTDRDSSFVITGRGGLPPSPFDALSSDAVTVNWIQPISEQGKPETSEKIASLSELPPQFVEVQGWVKGANGKVELVAQAPNVTPHGSGLVPLQCRVIPK